MTEDIPPDVRETLAQLLSECGTALEADDVRTARETAASAQSVASNKLPDSELRDHLRHGCDRVTSLLDDGDEEGIEIDAAAEYVAAMRRRFPGPD